MSVTNESSKVGYTASGNSSYPIPFFFTDNTHIKLYINDVEMDYNTHYTVTGANNESGGELTIIGTPPASGVVTILRDIPLKQENTFNEGGPNSAKTNERMFDKLTLITQQLNEKISRTLKLGVSSLMNPELPSVLNPGRTLLVNEAGDGFTEGPLATEVSNAQGYATAALASQQAAALSETNAADSASAASGSASSAANSATLAQQAADSVLFNDVIFVTHEMSPINIDDTYRGAMLACDCSLGPITINLPEISSLDLSYPWTVSIKKTDSSGNAVTINRAGTNLIDEGTTKNVGSASSGLTLIPDADPNPDVWTTAEFGAAAGNITTDRFSGNGSQTAFILSVAPGSENNTQVFVNGVYQQKNSYSLVGTTLTFAVAPAAGANNIEVNTGTTLPVGTPSDSTITISKLANDVLNFLIPRGTLIQSVLSTVPSGFVSAMNKTIGISGSDYNGSDYYNLFADLWAMDGLSTTVTDPFRISSAKGASALADWNAGKKITIDFVTNEVFVRAKGTGRNLGSYQADAFQGWQLGMTQISSSTVYYGSNRANESIIGGTAGGGHGLLQMKTDQQGVATRATAYNDGTNGNPRMATETRGKNVAVNYFIKY